MRILLLLMPLLLTAQAPKVTLELADTAPIEQLDMKGQITTMLLALAAIVAALFIVVWLFRRLMSQRLEAQNKGSQIKIIERRSLSPKSTLYVIEVNKKGFLIAESASGISHLGELPESPKQSEHREMSFTEILKKKFQKS